MPTVTLNDRSHIAIGGEEAEAFLHNLVTTDIAGLKAGQLRPGALLTAQGKVLFAFLIYRTEAGFVVDVATQDAADFAKRLRFFKLRAKVDIGDPVPVAVRAHWDVHVAPASALEDMRFTQTRVWRAHEVRAASALEALEMRQNSGSDAAWALFCITHGVAEAHADYAYGDVFPHDINLDQTGGMSFSKGCYVGQEVISRMHHRGLARRRLMMAKGEGLLSGAEISAAGKSAGTIGSVSGDHALALVRLDRIKEAMDKSDYILAQGQAITLSFPLGVTYDWPPTSGESSD